MSLDLTISFLFVLMKSNEYPNFINHSFVCKITYVSAIAYLDAKSDASNAKIWFFCNPNCYAISDISELGLRNNVFQLDLLSNFYSISIFFILLNELLSSFAL